MLQSCPVFYSPSYSSRMARMIALSRMNLREDGVSFISYIPSSLWVTISGGRNAPYSAGRVI